jgi:hypothetical protein
MKYFRILFLLNKLKIYKLIFKMNFIKKYKNTNNQLILIKKCTNRI